MSGHHKQVTFNHSNGEKVVVYRKSWWARLLAAAAMAWGSLAGGQQAFNQGGQIQVPIGGAVLVYSTGTVSVAFPAGALPVTSSYTVITATGAAKESFLPVRLVRADGSAFYDAGAATGTAFQVVGFSSGSFSNPFYILSTQTFPVSGAFFQAVQPISLSTGAVSVSGSTVSIGNASLAVTGTFFQASQPVSIATGAISVSGSTVSITGTLPVSLASVPTHAVTLATGAVSISGSSVTAFISGSVPVTGTFFQASQPTSLSTGAVSVSGSSVTAFISGNVPVTGTFFQAVQPMSLSTGAVSVSGSTVSITQIVTVAFSQNGADNNVDVGTVTVVGVNGADINVNVRASTVGVTNVLGASLSVVSTNTAIIPVVTATANNDGTCTALTVSASLLVSFTTRKWFSVCARIANTDTVYVKLGATATTSDFPLEPGQCFNSPVTPIYTGAVDAIAGSGTQTACVVEL